MVDHVSPERRSWMMSRVRSKNTSPEMAVRSTLHRLGYRFRLHVKKLPGNPDIVMRKYNAVIFVHGCFWHSHNCKVFTVPKSNSEFWQKKIERNVERDKLRMAELLKTGWRILIIWECAFKGKRRLDREVLAKQLKEFVPSKKRRMTIRGKR